MKIFIIAESEEDQQLPQSSVSQPQAAPLSASGGGGPGPPPPNAHLTLSQKVRAQAANFKKFREFLFDRASFGTSDKAKETRDIKIVCASAPPFYSHVLPSCPSRCLWSPDPHGWTLGCWFYFGSE